MTWEVTAAVLGAALLHAGWNVMVKSGADKELESYTIAASSGLIALLLLPFLPLPAAAAWPWVAASVAVHILYFICLAGAYRWGELSYVYPVMRGGGPLIVAVAGALALGEVLPPKETLGVLLISAGILAFASGRHERRATLFAIANAAVIAAYTLIDAQGARLSQAPVSYTLWFFALNGLAVSFFAIWRRAGAFPRYLRAGGFKLFLGGSFALGAYAIALWAMTRAPVALVAALRETSVIFAALLAAVFLVEKLTRRRVAATGAVLAGLIALRL